MFKKKVLCLLQFAVYGTIQGILAVAFIVIGTVVLCRSRPLSIDMLKQPKESPPGQITKDSELAIKLTVPDDNEQQ